MQAEDEETFEQLPIRPFFVYFDNSPVEEFTLVLSNLLCQRPSSVFPSALADTNSASLSPVHIIAIIDSPAYFTEEFFQKLKALDYPKNLLTITIVAKNEKKLSLISEVHQDFQRSVNWVLSVWFLFNLWVE